MKNIKMWRDALLSQFFESKVVDKKVVRIEARGFNVQVVQTNDVMQVLIEGEPTDDQCRRLGRVDQQVGGDLMRMLRISHPELAERIDAATIETYHQRPQFERKFYQKTISE